MELVSVNVGKTRREVLNGREYVVAPLTLIVEGVLNGSKGSLYYPAAEIARSADAWNGMPLVVRHPTKNGQHISGRDPSVVAESGIGTVYRSKFDGEKLTAEGWFDVQATNRVDRRIMAALDSGKSVELSTGLFTDDTPARNGAACPRTGRSYAYVARNYRPDHLAILPDQVGACSNKDGCGVNVNERYVDVLNVGELREGDSWIREEAIDGKIRYKIISNAEKCPECDAEMDGKCSCGYKANALPNQPQSKNTGQFKSPNAGTGKGPLRDAALSGAMVLTDEDRADGQLAATDVSWVGDSGKWDKAKATAAEVGLSGDWTVIAHIYRHMGGGRATPAENANPEGCNQYKPCAGGGTLSLDPTPPSLIKKGSMFKVVSGEHAGREGNVHAVAGGMISTHLLADSNHNPQKEARIHYSEVRLYQTANESQLPTETQEDRDMATRTENVTYLTTNCDCWKGKEKLLGNADAFSDTDLAKLRTNAEEAAQATLTVNALRETLGDEAEDVALNEMPAFIKEKIDAKKKGKKKDDEEEEDEEEPAANARRQPAKPLTDQQWLDSAPATIRSAVQNAIDIEREAKEKIVGRLVANVSDDKARGRLAKKLMTNSLPDLRDMASMLPVGNREDDQYQSRRSAPVYFGDASDRRTDNTDSSPPLDIPTLNYAEIVAERRKSG